MLAGVASGGVYSSTDNGATWQPPAPGNGMSRSETVWSIGALVPGVLFAATGSGVYRSLDNGSTGRWPATASPARSCASSPTRRPEHLSTRPAPSGVFRTINGGITWSDVDGPARPPAPRRHRARAAAVLRRQRDAPLRRHTNGVYAGTTGNGLLPGPIRWRKVDQHDGLGNNTIIWALKSFTTTPGMLLGRHAVQRRLRAALHAAGRTPRRRRRSPARRRRSAKTLPTTNGVWTGTKTIEYEYQWQRCTNAPTGVHRHRRRHAVELRGTAGRQELQAARRRHGRERLPDVRPLDGHERYHGVVSAAAGSIAGALSRRPPPTRQRQATAQPQPAASSAPPTSRLFNPAAANVQPTSGTAATSAAQLRRRSRARPRRPTCSPTRTSAPSSARPSRAPTPTAARRPAAAPRPTIVLAPRPRPDRADDDERQRPTSATRWSPASARGSTRARRSPASGRAATPTAAAARRSRAPRARPTSSRPPTSASACACGSRPTPTARTTSRPPSRSSRR